jgi:hypothetical protein
MPRDTNVALRPARRLGGSKFSTSLGKKLALRALGADFIAGWFRMAAMIKGMKVAETTASARGLSPSHEL